MTGPEAGGVDPEAGAPDDTAGEPVGPSAWGAVSYTHSTLPSTPSELVSEAAVPIKKHLMVSMSQIHSRLSLIHL